MRVVQVNSFGHLSTGSVMRENHRRYVTEGHESWMAWGRTPDIVDPSCEIKITTAADVALDALQTRVDGKAGFHNKGASKRFLAKLGEINPDLVHLHNLHGYYLNVEMLFNWLAARDCKVEWTLHDCWAFTGHCAYFTYVKCAQWQGHCAYSEICPQLNTYPKTISKTSAKRNFSKKNELFTMLPIERMTLITPSKWLANLVGQSFLAKYPVEVRYNTVDTSVFKPTPNDFRQRHGLAGKFVVLGVASTWSERKGLGDFLRLSGDLGGSCAVVLVGLDGTQLKNLPANVVGIKRTGSRDELAGIYTAADVFFNPTREDNYPTVNLEAEACGTPVVTYDTGGCAETIHREGSRVVAGYLDAVCAINAIRQLMPDGKAKRLRAASPDLREFQGAC